MEGSGAEGEVAAAIVGEEEANVAEVAVEEADSCQHDQHEHV